MLKGVCLVLQVATQLTPLFCVLFLVAFVYFIPVHTETHSKENSSLRFSKTIYFH